MNLPNKLTLLRVLLALVFMAFMMIDESWARWTSLLIFAGASLTDMLDGKIARARGMITTFGKFADPLADKMLTTAAFIVFTANGIIGPWPLFIILIREFAVSGIRLVAAAGGEVIAASFWGKFKTVTQMIAIIAGILIMCLPQVFGASDSVITAILVWITVVFTIISGAEYIIKNRKLLSFK